MLIHTVHYLHTYTIHIIRKRYKLAYLHIHNQYPDRSSSFNKVYTYNTLYIHTNANYSKIFYVFSLKVSLEEENRVTQECQELRTLSSNLQKEFQDLQHAYNNALSNGSAMEANIQALKQQLQK